MTQDIDIVVGNEELANKFGQVIAAFETSDFLFDETSVRTAVERRKMFQLLDSVESLKLDVYPRELVEGELTRSDRIELFEGVYYPIASRTDTAVAKLFWIDQGSHKSRRDLRHLFRNASKAEQEEIEQLAERHSKLNLLKEVLSEPDEIDR